MTKPDTKSKAKAVTEKVRDHAADVADQARDTVESEVKAKATQARDTAAEETQKAADAAKAAANEFDAGSMQAQAIEQVAQRIEDLAQQVRGTDIDRVARNLSDAARRNPVFFVAGATLLGFAATRFLKARDPQGGSGRSSSNRAYTPDYTYDEEDPWDAHLEATEAAPEHPNKLTDTVSSRGVQ